MKIIIVNGPNLNLLGEREPEIYGTDTLEELMMWLETSPAGSNHSFKFFQSNHEVEIHLSDIHNRENFRKISVIKSVCLAQVVGEGKQGYITAIKHILETK